MREEDTLRELQEDIVIPDIVQKKANQAFAQIKREENNNMRKQKKAGHFQGRRAAAAVAAVVLAIGSVTAVGASMHWSKGLSKGLEINEEQKENLEQKGATAFTMQSQTQNGITVTAEQSITDNYYVNIGFKVEGYQLPEGEQPDIQTVSYTLDGRRTDCHIDNGFYDGLSINKDGDVVYDDGSPIDENAENVSRYVQEDGSMEYWVTLRSEKKGYFLNKDIHIELQNIGTVGQAEFDETNMVEGTWAFDWNLKGTDKSREVTFDGEQIGNTEAKMIKAEISPISMHVEYQFPFDKYDEEETDDMTVGPCFAGVKLKDGTVYPYLCDGGTNEYKEPDFYAFTGGNDRIIDPDEVEYLMFQKKDKYGDMYSDEYYDFVAVK